MDKRQPVNGAWMEVTGASDYNSTDPANKPADSWKGFMRGVFRITGISFIVTAGVLVVLWATALVIRWRKKKEEREQSRTHKRNSSQSSPGLSQVHL